MGCMREMADALWEGSGHTLLKTELSAHRHTDATDCFSLPGPTQSVIAHW